jgi:hypothetical protein
VVKASHPRQTDDLGLVGGSFLDRAAFGSVANRGVDALRVVVLDVLPEQASQMVLAQDDYVIEQLSPNASNKALGSSVLPGTLESCSSGVDPEIPD